MNLRKNANKYQIYGKLIHTKIGLLVISINNSIHLNLLISLCKKIIKLMEILLVLYCKNDNFLQ